MDCIIYTILCILYNILKISIIKTYYTIDYICNININAIIIYY